MGLASPLYDAITKRDVAPLPFEARQHRTHRWHRTALLAPIVLFVPLYLLPWNPIYAALASLITGALASVRCRPDLAAKTASGGFLLFALYAVFMLALRWSAPGYIESVWNLPALTGVRIGGVPLEELVFGFTFGTYWSRIYEHLTWHTSRSRG